MISKYVLETALCGLKKRCLNKIEFSLWGDKNPYKKKIPFKKFLRAHNLMIIMLCLTAIYSCTTGRIGEKNWRLFDMDSMRDYYFDAGSIKELTKGLVRVKLGTVAKGNEARNWEIDERLKRGLAIKGYENYDSSQDIYEINCIEKKFRVLSGTDYDTNNNILSSYNNPSLEWKTVHENSAIMSLIKLKSVCSY